MTTTTLTQPETDQPQLVIGRRRIWTIAVIVLAVAVLGLGAWIASGPSSDAETAVSAEVQEVVDDYLAAWNSYDGEAFREVITENYVLDMVGATGSDTMQADEVAQLIDSLEAFVWTEAVIGVAMMTGDGPYYVSAVEHFTGSGYGPDGADGISTFTVVDDNGTLRVARHDYIGNN